MPVLHCLVAVCDGCEVRHPYEAPVAHVGEAAWDSINGTGDLTASDVEHDFGVLPPGWELGRRDYLERPTFCPECLKKDQK